MKSRFLKASVALPEQSLRNDLRVKFTPHLEVRWHNVLTFIQGHSIEDIASALSEAAAIADPIQDGAFYRTTTGILSHLSKEYQKILVQDNLSIRDVVARYLAGISVHDNEQLESLADKVNEDLQKTCPILVEAALAAQDRPLKRVSAAWNTNVDWVKAYYRPFYVPDRSEYENRRLKILAIMQVEDYEAEDFLYDYLSCEQYMQIRDNVFPGLTRKQREQFFDDFDDIIEDARAIFLPMVRQKRARGQMGHNINDPEWKGIARKISEHMTAASYHITDAAFAATWPGVKEDPDRHFSL